MDPARKRTVRLIVALSAALVLAGALVYTSFSAASPALSPSQLLHQARPGRSYQLTGRVVQGSVHRTRTGLDFSVQDRAGGAAILLLTRAGHWRRAAALAAAAGCWVVAFAAVYLVSVRDLQANEYLRLY